MRSYRENLDLDFDMDFDLDVELDLDRFAHPDCRRMTLKYSSNSKSRSRSKLCDMCF
jgi:hypothetical protein